jgi:hypothetical protein
MKRFLLTLVVLLGFATPALAWDSWNCQTFGNMTTCSGWINGQYHSITCYAYGYTRSCSGW